MMPASMKRHSSAGISSGTMSIFQVAVCSERVAVDVVGNSVLANAPLGATPASPQFFGADVPQRLHQVLPVRAGSHAVGRQLVVGIREMERRLV